MTETGPERHELPLICGGCGCWCDDLAHDPSDRPGLSDPCELGRRYFAARQALVAGHVVSEDAEAWDQRLTIAAQLLKNARRPLITGLSFSSLEAQRLAVAVADRCRAMIDPWQSAASVAKLTAFQQSGEISATWGEIKNRADVVIYWRCRPADAPRFRSRYGDLAEGQFVAANQRTIIVVDSQIDREAWQLPSPPTGHRLHFVEVGTCDRTHLRLLAQAAVGQSPSAEDLAVAGIAPDGWSILQTAIEGARYGAVVVGDLTTQGPASPDPGEAERVAMYQLLSRWVGSRNVKQRFVAVAFPTTAHQVYGIQAALTWRTGFPMAVDFSRGYPAYDPLAHRWRSLVEADQVDVVFLILGDGQLAAGGPAWERDLALLNQWAAGKPLLESGTQPRVGHAKLHFNTAGIAGGRARETITIGRPDGVLLPLEPMADRSRPSEAEMLERLLEQL